MGCDEQGVADRQAGHERGRGDAGQGARRDRHDPHAGGRAGDGNRPRPTAAKPLGLAIHPFARTQAPEEPQQRRPGHRPEQPVLDDATDDAGDDDGREGDARIEIPAARRDARADDHEVARDRDRDAGFLDEDQADDGQETRGQRFDHRWSCPSTRSPR